MSRLILLAAIAQIAVATSPLVAADRGNYLHQQSQPTQVVQQRDGRQLLQQGLQLYQTEQFSRSVQVLQQAAKTFQTQGDFLNQALSLNYVALANQQLGQLPQANTAIAESLNLLQKNRGNSKEYIKVRAQTLNNLGQIQLAEGKSEKALASWEEATSLYAKNRDSEGEIGSKMNQVQALQALGLYRRARLSLTDINKLLQAQPDSLLKANGLLSLGNALRVVGVLDEAQPQEQKQPQPQQIENFGSKQALEQSLAVASKLNSGELVSQIYLSLGNTAQALQRTDAAMQYYGQAAASSASPTTRLVAQINQLRLSLEEPQQQPKEVGQKVSYQNLQQTLLPQIQSQLDSLAPSRKTVYARINYAQTLACLRQKSEARGTAINAINVNCPKQETSAENITTNNIPEWKAIAQIVATAVEQAKSLEDKRAEAYALGTLGGLYEQTQQWNDAQKLTQQASALAENIPAPDIGYRWQWQLGRILKTKGDQTGAKAAYTKAVNNLKSIRGDLVAMREVQYSFQEEVEPIYRELVSLLLQSGSKQTSQDDLDTARNVIESLKVAELDNFFRRACVDTTPVQIDQIDRTAAVIYPVILPDRVEVIVSLPSSSTKQKQNQDLRHYTKVLPQKEVEDKLEELRQKLETRSTPEFLVPSQEIYQWIIQPIESELEKRQIKNLVFVLDGPMRSIPMAALYDGNSYLVQKYNIALTPGLELLNPQPFARTERRTIAGGLSEASQNFPALPAVKRELDEIKSTVRQSEVLLDKQFTTEAIKEAVKSLNAPVVHLATHGQFSSKAEDTFILTFDGRVKVNELSDLLKTRATNQRGAIELLVLSACSTAAGDNRAALGIAGVAIQAGARSTLASLWVVDDQATADIMGEFYKQLSRPEITKAQALKDAQLSLLKNPLYKHPYYWAPYVLVGNWL
ncbi:MAG: CHAT domain-containing protein [Scytonema hyalinum WJT4-NPBG1]|jgi:CHAT domain-containing protein|nr:CHAT domain-containing protein [Scytonema hyalinum WJT4-NPBG1]